ncbi:hypothetical protein ACFE04_001986 [Oxalis oulophora]
MLSVLLPRSQLSDGSLERTYRRIAVDGFLIYIEGENSIFNEELNTVEYVGGGEGDVLDVMSMHLKKSNVSMDMGIHLVEGDEDMIEECEIEVYAELKDKCVTMYTKEGDDDNDGGSDEDDISFCLQGEDKEFKELIQNTKSFTESAFYYEPVLEKIRQKVAVEGDQRGNEYDINYFVDTNYMDDPNLNWSMSDNDECVKEPNNGDEYVNIGGNDSGANIDGWEPMNVEGLWRDPKKIYFDPARPRLELEMIFKDRKLFKSIVIEDTIENCTSFKWVRNERTRVCAKCAIEGCD